MQQKIIDLQDLQLEPSDLSQILSRESFADIFWHGNLQMSKLFTGYFNTIPNFCNRRQIDSKNASAWFLNTYKSSVMDYCYHDSSYCDELGRGVVGIYYFLRDGLFIHFDFTHSDVKILFRKTEFARVSDLCKNIEKFRKRKRIKPEILLLVHTREGIRTSSLMINRTKLSIEDNYNDDFRDIHQAILQRLSKRNDKGIVLLHGKPGTGKTSYIRYLISSLRKDVIILPPDMARHITDPGMIRMLIENPNSILVIEDAENVIIEREKNGYSPASVLLNIADGLLSDCLNIQIICTFNTDISRIDNALLRKGRLIAKYEFRELEVQKAQALSKKLGFKERILIPMTLAEIYNQEERSFQESVRVNPIGFKANVLQEN